MVHVLQVCTFQVGSFNYAMDKLIFDDEFIPVKEEAVRSILDYEIEIYPLDAEEKQYSALNMNYSVAGFKLVLARKMSFYVVTYYLPSGLFVVVSWISFLVNPEVRSHRRFCQENSPQMCGRAKYFFLKLPILVLPIVLGVVLSISIVRGQRQTKPKP